jgi:glucose-6-phosphate-specific signal transduction histidine kinase
VPLIIEDPGPRRRPAAAEAAAYRMVADTVRAAGQNSTRAAVTVTLGASEDVLRVRLNTAGLDREAGELILAGAQDRVAVLDGSITLASEGGQMIIEAAIPCAS